MDKNSFILYMDYKEDFDVLNNEQKGMLISAIFEYQERGTTSISDPVVNMAFLHIRRQLDKDNEKYEDTKAKRSEAGKKAMSSRWNITEVTAKDNKTDFITNDNKNNFVINENNKNNKAISEITKITDNDNVNDNANVINKKESIEKKATSRFSPPSVEQVKEYCKERGNNVDADTFVDFYASKGWKVGNNPMKDWKAAVRTWERRDTHSGRSAPKKNGFNDFEQSNNDAEIDEMEELFLKEVNKSSMLRCNT